MKPSVFSVKDTFINSSGTLLSRLTGILKMNVVNFFLGRQADAFWTAFRLPNTLRRIVGEGALSNAFIPVYQKEKQEDKERADRFASTIINLFFLITLLIAILGIIGAKYFFPLLVTGFQKEPKLLHQAILLNMIMMPFVIEISLFSMIMGILNSHKRFFSPAYAPFFFNLAFILFPVLFFRSFGIYSFGMGVIVGGFTMVIIEIIELFQTDFRYHFILNLKDPALKKFGQLYGPSTVNMLILMANSLISMQFMSYFIGSVTVISNAFIINQAPVGFIGIAIGTVLLPILSGMKAKKDSEILKKTLREGFHLLFYLMIPFFFFFVFFPDTLIHAVYRDLLRLITGNTGRYTATLLAQTSKMTLIYAFGLIPFALNILFARIFYAFRDAKTPLRVNLIVLISSLTLYFMSFHPKIGAYGIVIADVAAAWIASGVYLFLFYRRYGHSPFPNAFKTLSILIFASLIAVGITFYLHRQYFNPNQPFFLLLKESAEFGLFFLVYFLIAKIFKIGLRPRPIHSQVEK